MGLATGLRVPSLRDSARRCRGRPRRRRRSSRSCCRSPEASPSSKLCVRLCCRTCCCLLSSGMQMNPVLGFFLHLLLLRSPSVLWVREEPVYVTMRYRVIAKLFYLSVPRCEVSRSSKLSAFQSLTTATLSLMFRMALFSCLRVMTTRRKTEDASTD